MRRVKDRGPESPWPESPWKEVTAGLEADPPIDGRASPRSPGCAREPPGG